MSRTPQAVVLEEVTFLRECGSTPTQIITRLGMTPDAISRSLQRAGRYDLAKPFQRIARRRYPRRTTACADCGTRICVESARCRSCEVTHRWGKAS